RFDVGIWLHLPAPLSAPCSPLQRDLPSFPTRRSSDLQSTRCTLGPLTTHPELRCPLGWCTFTHCPARNTRPSGAVKVSGVCVFSDRKSTRLNSSHVKISYAVFCLKKTSRAMRTTRRAW